MPEGDTIWRAAQTLHAALAGHVVTAFSSPIPRVAQAAERHRLVGSDVTRVEARGKHLLMHFSVGAVLRTHQRMTGSWHLYRTGSPWQKPADRARAVVRTAEVVAVCFSAPDVEILASSAAVTQSAIGRLGPDLLAEAFDASEALARLRARGDVEVGVALLDQMALAGIGNVYKSELLFMRGINPFDRVASLDDAALNGLLADAVRQMKRNLTTDRRRTTSGLAPTRFWVYNRARQPCWRCGTPITRRLQGPQARSTYWCPRCQPPHNALPKGAEGE